MNHTAKVRLCSFAMIAVSLAFYQNTASARAALQTERSQTIETIEAYNLAQTAGEKTSGSESTDWKDGAYEGEGQGFAGKITLRVTVENGKIDSIEVVGDVSDDMAYFNQAKTILDDMVKKQTANVDTVSGATFSSKGLIEAAQNALGKAVES